MNARLFIALLASFSLCSCAAVKVKDLDAQRTTAAKAPKKILVVPFSYANAKLKEHPARKHPGKLGEEAQKLLADYLVAELTKNLAPAALASPHATANSGTWVVSGDFTRINEGSRILRMSIGLGAGGTKMETMVAVQTASARKGAFRFATSGGSGSMPGGLTNPIPFSGGPTAALMARLGVSDDAARTARVITNRLLVYLGREPTAGVVKKK